MGIPLEANGTELLSELSEYSANAVKWLERKHEGKYIDCISVLLIFHPDSVAYGVSPVYKEEKKIHFIGECFNVTFCKASHLNFSRSSNPAAVDFSIQLVHIHID